MTTLLTVLHVIFCLFLILVILLQTGKGGGMGTAFGGSSQSVFGPRGAGSFIGKLTGIVAALFMLTSLTLAYLSSSTSSGIDERVNALNESASGGAEEVDLSGPVDEPAPQDTGSAETPVEQQTGADASAEEIDTATTPTEEAPAEEETSTPEEPTQEPEEPSADTAPPSETPPPNSPDTEPAAE